MATKTHQKLNGAAKRSGRTTRSRSLAAIMAGATLGGVLAAGGALGFIGAANAATILNGRTFIDIDGNGRLDLNPIAQYSDRPIGGVTVTAFERGGTISGTTQSKADGTWEMNADGIGPYRIEFSNLPTNTYEGFNTTLTNLQRGSNTASFGLFAKLDSLGNISDIVETEGIQIGDRVWVDTDGNGIQDPAEAGIAGVRVELLVNGQAYTDANNLPVTTVTDANGNYVFRQILQSTAARPLAYSVRVPSGQAVLAPYTLTTPNAPGSNRLNGSDGIAQPEGGAIAAVTAPKLGADMSYDFGYRPTAPQPTGFRLGDYVFLDNNNNGIQDAGDTPVANAKVELLNGTGQVLRTTQSFVTGSYEFTGLTAGNYQVRFTRPAGTTVVAIDANRGNDRGVDSDAFATSDPAVSLTGVFALNADNLTVDAGWKAASTQGTLTLGDYVFIDKNRDGVQDSGDTPVDGATVELTNAAGVVIDKKTTGADGKYLFTGLNQGNYVVRFTRPLNSNVVPTDSNKAGAADDVDSDAVRESDSVSNAAVNLTANNNTVDAGWVAATVTTPLYCVGDKVWVDANGDGLLNNTEAGQGGVTVTLVDAAGNSVNPLKSTTTAADGTWKLCDLPNGEYRVKFTNLPAGYKFTKQAQTANDGQSSADLTTGISLPGTINGKDCVCLDAGIVAPAVAGTLQLGDTVWIDANDDGIKQVAEATVADAKVELLDEAGNVIATTTTDKVFGKYLFTGLKAGKYRVRFTRPDGSTVVPAKSKVGTNDIDDSDGVRESDSVSITGVIDLQADNRNVDAGWIAAPVANTGYCLGDLVFEDVNGDGIKQDNERGVGGVVVTVTNSAGVSLPAVTSSATGEWKVCNLANGDYTVSFARPNGYDFTLKSSGNNKSNVDGSGKTGTVTIANGDNLNVDAGIRLTPAVVQIVTPVVVVSATVAPVTVAPTTAAPTTVAAPAANLCVGDKVFVDATGSAKDGKGISGVTVTLVRADGTTATATTDANGAYKFCSLGAGSYTVKVNPATLPAGAVATYDLAGKKNNEGTVTLTNADNADVDFGYKLPSASVLGNTVETAPPAPAQTAEEPIAFTGSNTTTTMLWGLALLMMGMGLAGLMVDRRRTVTR
jgi:SdrD B-like domain